MRTGIYYIIYCCRVFFTSVKDPFIRRFICDILKPASILEDPVIIKNYRKNLAGNNEQLKSISLGAGSKVRNKQNTIGAASERTSIRSRYGKLLHQLVYCFKPDMIIELGTAMGLSTTYLAKGNEDSSVITVEANSQLCDLAFKHFSQNKLTNITLINKLFDDVLPELATHAYDNLLVFIDGNHTYEGTLGYFRFFSSLNDKVILVFDDINWSAGMHKAWIDIQKSPESGLTIDLFQMGIVFQGKKKMKVALWY